MMRSKGAFLAVLAIVLVDLAALGLLFFRDSSPTPAQESVREAVDRAGWRGARLVERLTVEARGLGEGGAGLLLRRAPRIASLLGLHAKPATEAVQAPPQPPTPRYRVKSAEELRVEARITEVFQEYFRELTIGGKRLTIRMPFALNDEREGGPRYEQVFHLQGKGRPEDLWPYIEKTLSSSAFQRYVARISAPGDKAVVFSLKTRSYSVTTNAALLAKLERELYPGTPTRIFVRRNDTPVSEADVYNYLYAIASVGVDCSGFAYHVLESVAGGYGIEMDRMLAAKWRIPQREVRERVGMWFYDPANGYTDRVPDRIEELRPGDLILFRGNNGRFKHSAIIQSIDFEEGLIRYLQSTDWAGEAERGVHMSMIRFDPERTQESLGHYSVKWLQQVRPSFEGEEEPRDWQTDGDRYLWNPEAGGSIVARPRLLAEALAKAEPRFYSAGPAGDVSACGTPTSPSPSRSP